MGSRREEEMEMSDEDLEEEEKPCKRRRWSGEDGERPRPPTATPPDTHPLEGVTTRRVCVFVSDCCADGKQQQQQSLLEENDSLRWQLEAYRNEVELLRKEGAQRGHDPQQVQHIQQVQNLQQSLHSTQQVGRAREGGAWGLGGAAGDRKWEESSSRSLFSVCGYCCSEAHTQSIN